MQISVLKTCFIIGSFACSINSSMALTMEGANVSIGKSEIRIMGGQLEGLFEEGGYGVYNKILNDFFSDSPFILDITYGPFKRATRDFENQKDSCHFVASDSESFYKTLNGLEMINLLVSDPLNSISLRVYSLKGSKSVNSLDELSGKSVLVDSPAMNSLGLYINFPENVSWLTTNSAGQSYKLLEAKRGNYIIAYDLDLRINVGENFHDVVVWDPTLNLRIVNEVMVCHVTEENKQFIAYFNKSLKDIKENGQWEKYFPDYNLN